MYSRSPTPSTGSSQAAPVIGTSALSAAALKSQQSVTLTPSLSNFYNEKLIGHVLGWQGEQTERQVKPYSFFFGGRGGGERGGGGCFEEVRVFFPSYRTSVLF